MLSYRHAFHAGNHADVLKHLILLQIAEYLGEKPAPFWIIDTHAGAGMIRAGIGPRHEDCGNTATASVACGTGRACRRPLVELC